ncbi:fumarylacetoacetate hydrolase family protein [Clostridium sp. AM58-1XD]|uniref:fumarylacetoacetate hydrolase family protein n=1 Tax=Clostridium sp. AM58-1XD TaxID=2292307 RepID=UPI001FA8B112|nr:fumarylacetoacetate hydrolase family protein [Clostridium sp. AM58-1XD]
MADCPDHLLLPCVPSKIVGTGLNYKDVVLKPGETLPEKPKLFIKPPTTLIGDGESVILPPMVKDLSCEVELAVVIGKTCRCVPQDRANEYIWGYTVANDMTASDLQAEDILWGRAKSFDTFLPIGQYIVSGIDPSDLMLNSRINGEPGQHGRTKDLIKGISWLISYISHVMTLLPGDMIITGTPSGYGIKVKAGDYMEMEAEKIGKVSNKIESIKTPYYF